MRNLSALVMLFLVFNALYAQKEKRDTIKTQNIDEVTVVSHRVPVNVVKSMPVQYIDKAELERLGVHTVADAVKMFAGTNVRDYGGIGGLKTVSVRNLGAAHTAVSYDGVTVSNTQAGQIDIGRFSLDNVRLISLSVGQDDNIMQTARHYASAGVMAIETERPTFDVKNYKIRFGLQGGSFGYVNPTLRYWQKAGERTAIASDVSFMRADGAYPFVLKNGKSETREKRYNSDINTWHGEINVFHTLRDSSEIALKAYYFNSERGLPGTVILYNNSSKERLWDENFFAQATYDKRFAGKWRLSTRMKYNYSWNKYEDTDVKYDNGKRTDLNRQNEYYVSATLGWRPYKWFTAAIAQDIVFNSLRNNINEQPNPTRFTSLTALSAHINTNRITLVANVVGTFAAEKVRVGDKPEDRKRLSPTVSLSYRILPDKSLFARAMWKNTFRIPTFNDLYYLRIGNTGLCPEIASELNLGLTWNGDVAKMINVSATLDAYYNNVDDKIVAFPSTYVWKMTNFGKVRITGIDATISAEARISENVRCNFAASYTMQKAIDVTDKSSSYYKVQLPYTPKHSGSMSLSLRTKWIDAGYFMTACSEIYTMMNHNSMYKVDAYTEHSATLSREFSFRSFLLKVQGSVLNIADKQYEVIKYYPMPGRNWRLGFTLTF